MIEQTEEMLRTAQSATECEPSECDDCMAKAVAAVLAIVERDYVILPRGGSCRDCAADMPPEERT